MIYSFSDKWFRFILLYVRVVLTPLYLNIAFHFLCLFIYWWTYRLPPKFTCYELYCSKHRGVCVMVSCCDKLRKKIPDNWLSTVLDVTEWQIHWRGQIPLGVTGTNQSACSLEEIKKERSPAFASLEELQLRHHLWKPIFRLQAQTLQPSTKNPWLLFTDSTRTALGALGLPPCPG